MQTVAKLARQIHCIYMYGQYDCLSHLGCLQYHTKCTKDVIQQLLINLCV